MGTINKILIGFVVLLELVNFKIYYKNHININNKVQVTLFYNDNVEESYEVNRFKILDDGIIIYYNSEEIEFHGKWSINKLEG